MEDFKAVVSAPFKKNLSTSLSEKDFEFSLAFDLKWFSPKAALKVKDKALETGLLLLKNGTLVPGFNVGDVRIPHRFRPGEAFLEELESLNSSDSSEISSLKNSHEPAISEPAPQKPEIRKLGIQKPATPEKEVKEQETPEKEVKEQKTSEKAVKEQGTSEKAVKEQINQKKTAKGQITEDISFEQVLEFISADTGVNKQVLVSEINSMQDRLSYLVDIRVVALIISRKFGCDTVGIFKKVSGAVLGFSDYT